MIAYVFPTFRACTDCGLVVVADDDEEATKLASSPGCPIPEAADWERAVRYMLPVPVPSGVWKFPKDGCDGTTQATTPISQNDRQAAAEFT
jgi:hypothetical protein